MDIVPPCECSKPGCLGYQPPNGRRQPIARRHSSIDSSLHDLHRFGYFVFFFHSIAKFDSLSTKLTICEVSFNRGSQPIGCSFSARCV
jgi:hypothetical protein